MTNTSLILRLTPVTILNTLDPLGKFDGKADEGFLVGYFVSSSGPTWLFDIDTLTKSMNYQSVIAGNQPNPSAGIQEHFDTNKAGERNVQQYEPKSEVHVSPSSSAKTKKHDDKTHKEAKGKTLEDITYSDDEGDMGTEADFSNLETTITVSLILTTRVHKDHHVTQIIGDLSSATQTKSMNRMVKDQGHTKEEGIDYEEVFAPVARIKAIRLFLAYASFIGFMMYQMDVKSDFLYGTIEEETSSPPQMHRSGHHLHLPTDTTQTTMLPPADLHHHHHQIHLQATMAVTTIGTKRVGLGFGAAPLGCIGFMAAATSDKKGAFGVIINSQGYCWFGFVTAKVQLGFVISLVRMR
nr:ribonuclease H-like domain-containing protein [Tanacetum cinerariifolium]